MIRIYKIDAIRINTVQRSYMSPFTTEDYMDIFRSGNNCYINTNCSPNIQQLAAALYRKTGYVLCDNFYVPMLCYKGMIN